jgi:hypothetical protein
MSEAAGFGWAAKIPDKGDILIKQRSAATPLPQGVSPSKYFSSSIYPDGPCMKQMYQPSIFPRIASEPLKAG